MSLKTMELEEKIVVIRDIPLKLEMKLKTITVFNYVAKCITSRNRLSRIQYENNR